MCQITRITAHVLVRRTNPAVAKIAQMGADERYRGNIHLRPHRHLLIMQD